MTKIILLIACLISAFSGSSTSTDIECNYLTGSWSLVGSIYYCDVNKNLNILTRESAQISGISGSHKSSESNDDVTGIWPVNKIIQYFPRGLEKFLKNLKAILILSCQLKEIHQSDLKPFPKLVYFYLKWNAIEVIEEGLFDFNPNLEFIGFQETKIIHIDPNVFDHLNKLSYFMLAGVPCINRDVTGSISQVREAIKVVKSKCSNSEFLSLDEQLNHLKSGSEFFSKLSKFPSLQTKFDDLKLTGSCSNCAQLLKIQSLDAKVENLNHLVTDGLKNMTSTFDDPSFSQCGMNSTFDELKSSQNEMKSTLSSIKASVGVHETKIDKLQNSIKNIEENLGELKKNQNEMKNSLDEINKTLMTILKIC